MLIIDIVNNRPELAKALQHCRNTGATLVIAKLDRLSRDLHFISSLQKAGAEFIACDMPSANKFTVHIFAALAEHEREMISQRIKAALAALKARGVKLGNPGNLTKAAADKGLAMAGEARTAKADEFAAQLAPVVAGYRDQVLRPSLYHREQTRLSLVRPV